MTDIIQDVAHPESVHEHPGVANGLGASCDPLMLVRFEPDSGLAPLTTPLSDLKPRIRRYLLRLHGGDMKIKLSPTAGCATTGVFRIAFEVDLLSGPRESGRDRSPLRWPIPERSLWREDGMPVEGEVCGRDLLIVPSQAEAGETA